MCKKFLIALIALLCLSINYCSAEQPVAEDYKKMFRAGNFYVEFKDKWGVRILAGINGVRLERMRYDFETGSIAMLNPLGMIFGGEDKNPEVMYKDGKFYNFVEKTTKIWIRVKAGIKFFRRSHFPTSLRYFFGTILTDKIRRH